MARISKVTKEFNLGLDTVVDFLEKHNFKIDRDPNAKITDEMYELLKQEFQPDAVEKKKTQEVDLSGTRKAKETVSLPEEEQKPKKEEIFTTDKPVVGKPKVIGTINLATETKPEAPAKKVEEEVVVEEKPVEKQPEPKKIPVVEEVVVKKEEPKVVEKKIEEPAPVVEAKQNQEDEIFKPSNVVVENNVKVLGKINLETLNQKTRPDKKTKKEKEEERKKQQAAKASAQQTQQKQSHTPEVKEKKAPRQEENFIKTNVEPIKKPKVVGHVDLSQSNDSEQKSNKKGHRERIKSGKVNFDERDDFGSKEGKSNSKFDKGGKNGKNKHGKHGFLHEEVNEEEVDRNIKDVRSKLDSMGRKTNTSKHTRDKKEKIRQEMELAELEQQEQEKILKVTDVVSATDLSAMMNVSVLDIVKACFEIGLMISQNQRLEADTIQMIAENFGYEVQFVSADIQESIEEVEDKPEDLQSRPPIVTVMGHVDHGKTSLLDYIRKSNVIAGEAGGITQHIGAYSVTLSNGRQITFLDTPGHEAFTAMRARGAQVTDIAIIVVAADDQVMPQTIEAINHAAAAGVPIIFAINKIDKPGANPDRVREQLANMNYLVEEWGGKYQSQEIAAKFGKNVDLLMEKVLLEADMLELKANPNKPAQGTVIESKLDKGRGFTTNVLISSGTLRVGDVILAGMHSGKIKAMFNEREQRITEAGPSTPVMVLGLDGAPQAGDKIHVMESEREARDIAAKRERLQREQELRAMKPETLEDIARKIKIGNVQELNLIVKGDVGGSIEALSDSLLKLSTEEIQIVIKHKAVGQISESDVLLASASKAIIVGFQVRPSADARRLAEKLGIDIRLYSIIYDAINEVKDAMAGMLSPEIKEEITGSCEVRQVFKISKVGTVAGCFVTDGKITRSSKVRIIRDGIVVHTGELSSLRKVKEDVKEMTKGFECGLSVHNYNDIHEGDMIEAFEEKEVQRTL
ncbi:MAG: translation initiation factor IF-2 [Bacteroidales bacterium]|nr:translation initiation factor IF-2 [Bacteroidales bacterium]